MSQKINLRFEKRPKLKKKALVQLSFEDKSSFQKELPSNLGDASMYNVWYDKWYSEGKQKYNGLANPDSKAISKCNPEKDSGLTKADLGGARDAFFCIYFAMGCCGKGWQCKYLHRVPTVQDEEYIERTFDCFGRQRHRFDREDLMGVGSFERECKTLSVSRMGNYDEEDYDRILCKHFGQFGDILKTKSIHAKQSALVKFNCRLNAEFAKVAMNEQSLDQKEVIVVKWAPDDAIDEQDLQSDLAKAQSQFVKHLIQNQQLPAVQSILMNNLEEKDLNEYYENSQLTSIQNVLMDKINEAQENPELILKTKDSYNKVPPPPPPKNKNKI